MSVLRLTIKLALLVILLMTAPIALIRLQPYDDSELRAFLNPPEGCPAPCFMGIRPRVTSIDEAVRLLEAHSWVQSVTVDYIYLDAMTRYPVQVYWEWSGQQPSLINDAGNRELWLFSRDVVSIDVDTGIAMGELILAMGKPDNEHVDYSLDEAGCSFVYNGWYQPLDLTVVATGSCPAGSIYSNKVSLRWMNEG
ncbi:MAG: hypothetical protein CL610_22000 [Anaerolineaceae bacterium]|nr:hypothetical protein [Anaerolineaceae bacterium]